MAGMSSQVFRAFAGALLAGIDAQQPGCPEQERERLQAFYELQLDQLHALDPQRACRMFETLMQLEAMDVGARDRYLAEQVRLLAGMGFVEDARALAQRLLLPNKRALLLDELRACMCQVRLDRERMERDAS